MSIGDCCLPETQLAYALSSVPQFAGPCVPSYSQWGAWRAVTSRMANMPSIIRVALVERIAPWRYETRASDSRPRRSTREQLPNVRADERHGMRDTSEQPPDEPIGFMVQTHLGQHAGPIVVDRFAGELAARRKTENAAQRKPHPA